MRVKHNLIKGRPYTQLKTCVSWNFEISSYEAILVIFCVAVLSFDCVRKSTDSCFKIKGGGRAAGVTAR